MDWANEKYVRLFVRDTVTWKMLPWQSRLLLPAILRKLDRSGVMDLSGHGLAAVAVVTEVPLEFVEQAMPALLKPHGQERVGVFTIDADRLTMPNYIPAQETRQSDAQRKRDSREKRAAGGDCDGRKVTNGHQESPEVTLTPDLPQSYPQTDPDPRARVATGVPSNDPWKPSARYVLDRFAVIRAETCGGKATFWQASPKATEKTARWLAEMDQDACQDIEPAIKLACECVRDGKPGWTDQNLSDPAFLLGAIVSKWSSLRERLHGCAPKVKTQSESPKWAAPAPSVR